ncbi:MAG TPA: hypothetical protein VKE94_11910 [Gemmataceae bacterium]|nr:hypothetical protein [Gemmataceae bacterium]
MHAFRVVSESWMSGPWMIGPIEIANRVEEIPVKDGAVGPLRDAYFAYYYLILPVLEGSHSRTVDVLLYRRGYELVEIPARPWWSASGSDLPEKVSWNEAPDLLAQKTAVDRIAFRFGRQPFEKDVLQFAASEYARLTDCPLAASPETSTTKAELERLARECRQKAVEPQ